MACEDTFLIGRLKLDDLKAFDDLFKKYHQRVYNVCYRFLRSREDAEEIVQIVFVAVWENRKDIDENRPFAFYIQAIARNWINNYLKKIIYKKGFVEYELLQGEKFDYSLEEEVMYNELKELLERSIEQMSPRRKEIFRLSRNYGLSYKEIADKLSITESTVNTQITKAIEFLRFSLRDYSRRE